MSERPWIRSAVLTGVASVGLGVGLSHAYNSEVREFRAEIENTERCIGDIRRNEQAVRHQGGRLVVPTSCELQWISADNAMTNQARAAHVNDQTLREKILLDVKEVQDRAAISLATSQANKRDLVMLGVLAPPLVFGLYRLAG